jgi:hypothetical protein
VSNKVGKSRESHERKHITGVGSLVWIDGSPLLGQRRKAKLMQGLHRWSDNGSQWMMGTDFLASNREDMVGIPKLTHPKCTATAVVGVDDRLRNCVRWALEHGCKERDNANKKKIKRWKRSELVECRVQSERPDGVDVVVMGQQWRNASRNVSLITGVSSTPCQNALSPLFPFEDCLVLRRETATNHQFRRFSCLK